ncbi:hypothetical protein COV17_03595 [Candidatus Woesearchaeota archaeon CG10_big_fil_rev_8_21_14_0_10_36_11]|nr:MAG: hypothetical protein COV17_03595 [Candidatus Woesearchaeota archaeon CG10_big_fil_rev_8_21_14_0_10_36_11]
MSYYIRTLISVASLVGLVALNSCRDTLEPDVTTKVTLSTPQENEKRVDESPGDRGNKRIEDRTLDDYITVPESVRAFRKGLDYSPNGHEYVLVELAPQMGVYILTHRDGSDIKNFAKTYLSLNGEERKSLVHKPKEGYEDFITFAFNTVRTQPHYTRIRRLAKRMDSEGDKVLTPLNMISR